jgi:hypothetical protein
MLVAENAGQTTKIRMLDINVRRLMAPLISLCHCCVKNKRGDAIGVGGDESDEALA